MNTIRYLSDPTLAPLLWPAIVTGLAIAALCSLLSVLVAIKRLAFIGQGISHAAFGGVGVAAYGASLGAAFLASPLAQFGVVFLFCLGAAVVIGMLTTRGKTEADTAIGIVLVLAMGVGAILLRLARSGVAVESFLFGDIFMVDWTDAITAWVVALLVLGALWWVRRPLMFWAFDEPAAGAWGVHRRGMQLLLLCLLALATVTAMKLAGVILTTAMLVLPGASALRAGRRLGGVLVLACVVALAGVLGGLVLSFELDWASGPSIVVVLSAAFALSRLIEMVRARRRNFA